MVYKRFYFEVVIRVILTFATGFAFLQLFSEPNLLYVKLFLLLLTLTQLLFLIRYMNKINRKLSLFFESVKTQDYNVTFKDRKLYGEFAELNIQLDQLSKHFKEVLLKRAEQDEYFKAVIEHVGTGIFAFDEKGSVRFINSAALNIFGISRLKNIFVLDNIHKDLSVFFQKLYPGQQQLLELRNGIELLQLAAKVTKYKISGEELNLVSLQNIKPELDLKETETWQKMIRILTHEIMNSVSPITSLASSLSALIKKDDPNGNLKTKLERGLTTIKNRGEGMMDFVRKYRNLTILPLPQIAEISLIDLMNELIQLFEETFEKDQIEIEWNIEPNDLKLNADREQVEQVIINLIKNSIWALQDQKVKKISTRFFVSQNKRVQFEISDTGKGLEDELMDKIFIPFFTTHSEGTGIGLSLARQIMLMHGGSISANPNKDGGATFILQFGGSQSN